MKTEQTYLPKNLRSTQSNMKERAEYYIACWPTLHAKWKRSGALDIAFDKAMRLGQWRNMIQELYGIELTL